MKSCLASVLIPIVTLLSATPANAQQPAERNPADHLPPHITRLTWFGERADFSHDGKRILFVEKTYGDVFEVDVATRIVRPVTHHFYHGGFTRALYLSNGDILLSGSTSFDAEKPHLNRSERAELWLLGKSLTNPPVRLGEKCSEGPAVSRNHMRIAWTQVHGQYPDRLPQGASQIWMADVLTDGGAPKLANKRLVLDSTRLPFKCTLEVQNFRPPGEKELTFSAYGYNGTEVMGVDIGTGNVVNYSNSEKGYDEPEGIFPDGQHTLVECDKHNVKGWRNIDIYKLRLDGTSASERLTHFNDSPGYKASNPIVSDDGRFMAFQLAKTTDHAGVGYGIFLFDLVKAGK